VILSSTKESLLKGRTNSKSDSRVNEACAKRFLVCIKTKRYEIKMSFKFWTLIIIKMNCQFFQYHSQWAQNLNFGFLKIQIQIRNCKIFIFHLPSPTYAAPKSIVILMRGTELSLSATRGLYYKTYFGRNVQIFVVS
jgi:hypothetical protein